jgi:hypothetical protein
MYDFVQIQYGQQIAKNLGQITEERKKTQKGYEKQERFAKFKTRAFLASSPPSTTPFLLFRTDDVTFFMAQSLIPWAPHSQGWHHVEVTCSGKAANLSVFFASGQRNMVFYAPLPPLTRS